LTRFPENDRHGPGVGASRAEVGSAGVVRLPSVLLQIGVVTGVMAVLPLSRLVFYNEAKAVVLEIVGLGVASLCLMRARTLAIDRTDLLFGLFLVVSIASSVFVASEKWEALRATGLFLSGAATFWSSRYLGQHGRRQPLLHALTIAILLIAVTVLLEAFGIGLQHYHTGPAGTQSDRNAAGHLLAIGMPLLFLQSMDATRWRRFVGIFALSLSAAALVLTRSRAGWLATLLGTVLPLMLLPAFSGYFKVTALKLRCGYALGALLVGGVLAALIPTKLNWSAQAPYLESAKQLLVYNHGSGHARVQQYGRTLAMIEEHPLLGVGPGNWRIAYPSYLLRKLPPRVWYPQHPSSDWIDLAAGNGIVASILFFATLGSLALGCWRTFATHSGTPPECESSLEAICAIEVIVSTLIAATFDAVLQFPAPAMVFFMAAGTLTGPEKTIVGLRLSRWIRAVGGLTFIALAGLLTLYFCDRVYVDFLMVDATGGGSMQAASRYALDGEWFYNEQVRLAIQQLNLMRAQRR